MRERQCLDDESALAFADGTLPADARDEAERHLDACVSCRRLVSTLARSRSTSSARCEEDTSQGDEREIGASFSSVRIVKGSVVGRFVVIGPVGAGGMGLVYSAYDPELDRKVALKLLHRSSAEGSVGRDRVLTEAQAMAQLMHPNVVAVYDVGTYEGRLWIAMEFVEGKNLRHWLRDQPRSTNEVLRVLLAAGRGLEAAHAAGLVHRDFKPDNVLIAQHGGAVKVTDFGLAKTSRAMADAKADTSLVARREIAGTPAYMSPEQRLGHELDARSDQYSFAATLFEALYGELPYARDSSARDSELRFPPSPNRISASVRLVLSRALRRERAERFASMSALIHELVEAPRRRRRRLSAILGGTAVFGLAGGFTYRAEVQRANVCAEADERARAVWNAPRKEAIRLRFETIGKAFSVDAWRGVEASLDRFIAGWVDQARGACVATRVKKDESEETFALRSACLGRRLEELDALAELLVNADDGTAEHAVSAAARLTPLDACKSAAALAMQPLPPSDSRVRAEVQKLRVELATVKALLDAAKYSEGSSKADACVAKAEGLAYAPVRAEALYLQGALRDEMSNPRGAEASLEEAAAAAEASRHDEIAAKARTLLVWVIGYRQARYEIGEALAPAARGAILRAGSRPDLAAPLENNVGTVLWAEGKYGAARERYDDALALWQRAFGPEHSHVADSLNNRGLVLWNEGDLGEALAAHEAALAMRIKLLGPAHPFVASSLNNIGLVEQDLGRFERARDHHRRAIDIEAQVYGFEHPLVANALNNLGLSELGLGDDSAALADLTRAYEIRRRTRAPDHPDIANSLVNLAMAYSALHRTSDAIEAAEEAYARRTKETVVRHPALVETLIVYSNVLRTTGRTTDAHARAVEASALAASKLGRAHPLAVSARTAVGVSLVALGRPIEALPILEDVLAHAANVTDALVVATAASGLARALAASKTRTTEIPRHVELARARFRAAGARGRVPLAELEAWADRR